MQWMAFSQKINLGWRTDSTSYYRPSLTFAKYINCLTYPILFHNAIVQKIFEITKFLSNFFAFFLFRESRWVQTIDHMCHKHALYQLSYWLHIINGQVMDSNHLAFDSVSFYGSSSPIHFCDSGRIRTYDCYSAEQFRKLWRSSTTLYWALSFEPSAGFEPTRLLQGKDYKSLGVNHCPTKAKSIFVLLVPYKDKNGTRLVS